MLIYVDKDEESDPLSAGVAHVCAMHQQLGEMYTTPFAESCSA